MDQPPTKRRFRFGLRTLLLLVLVCAVGIQAFILEYSALERRARRIKLGMTKEQVNQIMGPPFLSPPAQYSPIFRNTRAGEVYKDEGRVWKPHVWIEVEYLEGGVRYVLFSWSNANGREHWVPPKK